PRFFVPEHGTMFTLALVRFPPTATKEIQYLNAKGALTYTDIAGDPVLYGNLPPREISMKDVFRSGDSSKKFKIAEGQWFFPLSAADLPPSPTKSSNLSETAEVPACNVPSRSPLPALAIAPETKLGTASSGLGTLEP